MLTIDAFATVLRSTSRLLPYGKALDETAILFAWQGFPEQAKHELSDADFAYGANQYLLDPQRIDRDPIHVAILRYLYRCGDGRPRLDWGLRYPNGTPGSNILQPLPAGSLPAAAA